MCFIYGAHASICGSQPSLSVHAAPTETGAAEVSEPLSGLLAAGRLRKDFAYRIAGIRVKLPPLRERRSDVRLLAAHFLRARDVRFDAGALDLLERHSWPGNVRELRSLLESVALMTSGTTIRSADVSRALGSAPESGPEGLDLGAICEAHGWNLSRTARTLGIARSTLYLWLEARGIQRPPVPLRLVSDRTS